MNVARLIEKITKVAAFFYGPIKYFLIKKEKEGKTERGCWGVGGLGSGGVGGWGGGSKKKGAHGSGLKESVSQ